MKKILVLFLAFFISNFSFSQEIETEQNDTTKINFDSEVLEASPEIGEGIQRLTGSVVLTHDSVVMTCDTAFLNQEANTFLGIGNVHLNQGDTVDIWSESLYYDGMMKIGQFRREVVMKKDSMTLVTDSLDFNLNDNLGYYEHGAVSGNETDTLISKIGIFDSNSNEFRFRTEVEVRSPKQVIFSDTLNYNTTTKVSTFLGPTEILGDSNYIYCENGWYNHAREIAQFNKNALLTNGSNTLKGDSLYYNRTKGYGESFKNVTLIDTVQNMIISGRYGKYIEKTEYSFVADSALLKHIVEADTIYLHADTLITIADTAFYRSDSIYNLTDTTIIIKDSISSLTDTTIIISDSISSLTDTTIIISDSISSLTDTTIIISDSIFNMTDTTIGTKDSINTIEPIINEIDSLVSYIDTLVTTRDSVVTTLDSTQVYKHVRAYNKVKMYKSNFQIKSDSLAYSTLDSVFRVFKQPILWSDSMQVTSDSIFIFTKKNKPEHAEVMGAAFLIMKDSGEEYNQVKGTTILAYFKKSDLYKIDVEQNAKSIFYVKDKADLVGINKSESASMQIIRTNGEIEFVKWFKQIKGVMYPEDKMSESEKKFSDFLWREVERPKRWQDVFIWEENLIKEEIEIEDEEDEIEK